MFIILAAKMTVKPGLLTLLTGMIQAADERGPRTDNLNRPEASQVTTSSDMTVHVSYRDAFMVSDVCVFNF